MSGARIFQISLSREREASRGKVYWNISSRRSYEYVRNKFLKLNSLKTRSLKRRDIIRFPRVLITAAKAQREKRVTSMTKRVRNWTNWGVRFTPNVLQASKDAALTGIWIFPSFGVLSNSDEREYKSGYYAELLLKRWLIVTPSITKDHNLFFLRKN